MRRSIASFGAIEAGRKPGRPLSILSNVTRKAPLGSLLAAFLLGGPLRADDLCGAPTFADHRACPLLVSPVTVCGAPVP
jgi:hypothetical protein